MLQRPFCCNLLWNFLFRRLPGFCLVFFVFLGVPAAHGQAQPLDVQTNIISGTCNHTNDTLTIILSGGTSPYQVSITGGPTTVAPFSLSLAGTATSVSRQLTGLGLGDYTIVVTDAGTPAAQVTKYQTVSSIPGPSGVYFSQAAAATCVNNDGVADALIVDGTPPYTFFYSGKQVGMTAGASTTGQITGLPAGYVILSVHDANGCIAQGAVTIDPIYDLTLVMDNNTTICQGTSKQLTINSNATSYSWMPAAGLSSDTAKDPIASPTVTTAYTLQATLGVCTAQGSLNIEVLPAPVATAVSPDTTCYGKNTYLQGGGGVQYMWSPSTYLSNPTIDDPLVIAPKSSVVYSLTVTDANGCKSITPAKVNMVVRAPYQVFAGDDTSVVVGQSVDLNAVDVQGVGFNQYVWTPAEGLSNPLIADPVATFGLMGSYTYTVTATAPDGCSGFDNVTVKVYALADIFVPNAFTPNGDGHNDVLRAIPVSMRSFNYLSVFSRWGVEVFTTTNAGEGWDGTYKGQPVPAGTYVWMVGGVDYTGRVVEKRGTVMVVR